MPKAKRILITPLILAASRSLAVCPAPGRGGEQPTESPAHIPAWKPPVTKHKSRLLHVWKTRQRRDSPLQPAQSVKLGVISPTCSSYLRHFSGFCSTAFSHCQVLQACYPENHMAAKGQGRNTKMTPSEHSWVAEAAPMSAPLRCPPPAAQSTRCPMAKSIPCFPEDAPHLAQT